MSKIVGSKRLRFGGYDFGKMLTVALWSGGSALAYSLIGSLEAVNWTELLGKNAVYAVAGINVLAYAIKEFFSDTRSREIPVE